MSFDSVPVPSDVILGRRVPLTNELAASSLPAQREYAIEDDKLKGFFLRVQPNGAKSWIVRRTVAGKHCRLFLGSTKKMSAEAARTAFRVGAVGCRASFRARGITFEQFARRYLRRMRAIWKPSTHRTVKSQVMKKTVPWFKGRRLAEIAHADVAAWFFGYSRDYPGGANRALETVRAMYNAAVRWGDLPESHKNPAVGLPPNRCHDIGKILSDEEFVRLNQALARRERREYAAVNAIRMLMHTGCRRGEILNLKWREWRGDKLIFRDTKTGPRILPISEEAQQVLVRYKRYTRHPRGFVFRRPKASHKPLETLFFTWGRIRKEAKLPPTLRVHDLRHTYASYSVMSGESIFVTGRLLGHRHFETTARYTHMADTHLSEVAGNLAEQIWAWLKPTDRMFVPRRAGRAMRPLLEREFLPASHGNEATTVRQSEAFLD